MAEAGDGWWVKWWGRDTHMNLPAAALGLLLIDNKISRPSFSPCQKISAPASLSLHSRTTLTSTIPLPSPARARGAAPPVIMATSLAAQLAQVAANSKSTLNVKAQKAAHSKSLIWEPRVAATQNYQTLYTTCIQGFEELCQLDARFAPFQSTIFSEESQNQDRTQLTASENEELDRRVGAFLRLAGSRLRLMPAIKAIEWLIRRFRYGISSSTEMG